MVSFSESLQSSEDTSSSPVYKYRGFRQSYLRRLYIVLKGVQTVIVLKKDLIRINTGFNRHFVNITIEQKYKRSTTTFIQHENTSTVTFHSTLFG